MFDAQIDGFLPTAIAGEIDRAEEKIAALPPQERLACALMVAARLKGWAHDLERMSERIVGYA